jgi:type III secretion protein C
MVSFAASYASIFKNIKRMISLFSLIFSLLSFVTNVSAAELKLVGKPVEYVFVEPKDIKVFLREFAVQHGFAIQLDPEIKGEIAGRYSLSPKAMMDTLSRNYGFVWFYDGRVVYLSPASSVESDVIRLGETTPSQLNRSLALLGIADSRFPLSFDPDRGIVMVSGPKRYVELVRQAAASPNKSIGQGPIKPFGSTPKVSESANPYNSSPLTVTKVFGLKYAFADDYSVRSGGRDFRIAGVVSILKQTFGQNFRGPVVSNPVRANAEPRSPLASLSKSGGALGEDINLPNLPATANRAQRRTATESASESKSVGDDLVFDNPSASAASQLRGIPSFAADSRTNSIVIRDIPARIDSYGDLIQSLDERPRLVEIETNIVEVSSDAFEELGVDWRILNSRFKVELGSGGLSSSLISPPSALQNGSGNAGSSTQFGGAAGGILSFVAGNRTQLVAKISALERTGRAWFRAQPKISTLNNIEAILESNSTFYVRVAGFQDAQLFDINVGTSIRITPTVVNDLIESAGTGGIQASDPVSIRLVIKIDDGAMSDKVVDQIPVIQRSSISTQALIPNGSTLLIAGYSQERETLTNTGVPLLSNIPIIGGLFKGRDSNRVKVEKLYMISPRLVDLPLPGQTLIDLDAAKVSGKLEMGRKDAGNR